MSEGDIKVKIGASGATEAASQVEKLTASLEKQRKTQELIANTSAKLQRQNIIDSLKKEAAEVNKVSEALQKNQATTIASGSSIASFSENTNQLRSRLGPAAGLVGQFTNSLSQLAPEATTAAKSLQIAGMAANQMLGVIGGGPGAIVIGTLVAGVTALTSIMAESSREADDLAKSTRDNAEAMGDWLQQIQTARGMASQKISGVAQEGDLQRRLREKEASAQEYQTEIAAQREMASKKYTVDALVAARKSGGQDAVDKMLEQQDLERKKIDELGESYASAAAEAQQLTDEQKKNAEQLIKINNLAQDVVDPKKKEQGSLLGNDGNDYLMEQVGGYNQSDAVMNDQKKSDDLARKQYDQAAAMRADDYERKRQEEESFLEWSEDKQGTWIGRQEQLLDELAQKKDQIRAQEKAAEMAAVQMMTGATLKGVSEVIKGKKLELGAIMESLGDQFVAAGTGLVFTGLGLSANPLMPGSGSGMVSIGTAEIAFGLGLGAAGARMPGGSNSGGGGAKADSGSASASPYRDSFTPSATSGPTIININMPTVVSPSPEDGIRIQQALDAKLRVYGK